MQCLPANMSHTGRKKIASLRRRALGHASCDCVCVCVYVCSGVRPQPFWLKTERHSQGLPWRCAGLARHSNSSNPTGGCVSSSALPAPKQAVGLDPSIVAAPAFVLPHVVPPVATERHAVGGRRGVRSGLPQKVAHRVAEGVQGGHCLSGCYRRGGGREVNACGRRSVASGGNRGVGEEDPRSIPTSLSPGCRRGDGGSAAIAQRRGLARSDPRLPDASVKRDALHQAD